MPSAAGFDRVLRVAFDSQYFAAISTVRAAAIMAHEHDLWTAQIATRPCWEALLHTAYFTHLYLTPASQPHPDPPAWVNRDALSMGWSWDPPYVRVESTGDPASPELLLPWIGEAVEKAAAVIASETADSFAGPSSFDWLPISRAELHVYNIRHIQHHGAQVEAMLRRHGCDPQWIGRRKA